MARSVPVGSYRVLCDDESGPTYRAGVLEAGPGRSPTWRATVDVRTYDLRRVRLVSVAGGVDLEAEITS